MSDVLVGHTLAIRLRLVGRERLHHQYPSLLYQTAQSPCLFLALAFGQDALDLFSRKIVNAAPVGPRLLLHIVVEPL